MHQKRVLVIEDNEDNLFLMRTMLARAEYEVIEASDGIVGLEIARQEQPDIILLDLALPELDGWEVARKLKTYIQTKEIPIIAVTAHSLPKNKQRALDAGCDAIVGKPFNIAKLVEKIEILTDW